MSRSLGRDRGYDFRKGLVIWQRRTQPVIQELKTVGRQETRRSNGRFEKETKTNWIHVSRDSHCTVRLKKKKGKKNRYQENQENVISNTRKYWVLKITSKVFPGNSSRISEWTLSFYGWNEEEYCPIQVSHCSQGKDTHLPGRELIF